MKPLLELQNVRKVFPVGRGDELVAVDDVSLTLGRGEVIGIVGESGCGKSTLSRLIARLIDPSAGQLHFDAEDLLATPITRFAKAPTRRRIQMVFQDATDSLNTHFTAFDSIADPVRRMAPCAPDIVRQKVERAAERVGLSLELLGRRPHQLSGGQKARVGIARAIVLEPQLLILDEPTSALDVSVQSMVLKTLATLRRELGLAYVFVSHDLRVVELLSDRVAVMYLGRVVEMGPAEEVLRRPRHPYTIGLASARPKIIQGPRTRQARLEGETSSPINPNPNQCYFASRCSRRQSQCLEQAPALRPTSGMSSEHWVACHFPPDPIDGPRATESDEPFEARLGGPHSLFETTPR